MHKCLLSPEDLGALSQVSTQHWRLVGNFSSAGLDFGKEGTFLCEGFEDRQFQRDVGVEKPVCEDKPKQIGRSEEVEDGRR
mmetsp:Transcript_42718/g.67603  ORF Transcript_42718/g.67603 Transcript_42718/m.67603 type:complete len:81 (-) Transcript_42718:64-306(-)